jgi:putative glutamine amidotransferase
MNVAFGGSLHQKVHELPGHLNHLENKDDPLDVQYAPSHEVTLAAGGEFVGYAAGRRQLAVNSLHAQGVDRLGAGLLVEATAPDGLVEAFRVDGARSFAVGVQWHPEWKAMENEFSRALFAAFGKAARLRAGARR